MLRRGRPPPGRLPRGSSTRRCDLPPVRSAAPWWGLRCSKGARRVASPSERNVIELGRHADVVVDGDERVPLVVAQGEDLVPSRPLRATSEKLRSAAECRRHASLRPALSTDTIDEGAVGELARTWFGRRLSLGGPRSGSGAHRGRRRASARAFARPDPFPVRRDQVGRMSPVGHVTRRSVSAPSRCRSRTRRTVPLRSGGTPPRCRRAKRQARSRGRERA